MSNLEAAGGGDESLVPAREDDIGVRSFLTQIVFGYVVNLRADGSVESIEPVLPARTPPTQAQSIARKIEGMASGRCVVVISASSRRWATAS